jgi:hypothetical protein
MEVVSEAVFYPQTPQGGLYKPLFFNSSAKRNLGVFKEMAFETAPIDNQFRNKKNQSCIYE